jgi:hypothetical protein
MPKKKSKSSKLVEVPREIVEYLKLYKAAKSKIRPKTTGLKWGEAQNFDASAIAWKNEQKKLIKSALSSEFSAIARVITNKETSGKHDKIDKAWDSFKGKWNDDLAKLASTLEHEARLQGISKKEVSAMKNRFLKKFRSTMLDNSRKQEFSFYLMSNRMDEFNPRDFDSALFSGDINLDYGNESIPIQLKQTNGYFRLDYSEGKFWQEAKTRNLASKDPDVIAKRDAIFAAVHLGQELNKRTLEKINSPERKAEAMKHHVKMTAAKYYILRTNPGISPGPVFDLLVPKNDMVELAGTFFEWFKMEKTKKSVVLKWVGPSSLSELFDATLRFSNLQVYSYDERQFYKIKGSTRKKGLMTIEESQRYRRKNIEKGSTAEAVKSKKGDVKGYRFSGGNPSFFLAVHEQFYGGIHYVKEYRY